MIGAHTEEIILPTPVSYLHPIVHPTLPEADELLDEMRVILASGRVTTGGQVAAFESEARARTGAGHAIAVSSGTSGLMLLLRALGLPRGSEVITPSFTFAATAHALLWNGLKPVFCDSEPESFTMDAAKAEDLITERTSAIYPVCIFGVPGDLNAYRDMADRHNISLLFDSAQGLGSTYMGIPLGNFGAGEVFSLSPTKVVTAVEGGVVTTNDGDLADRIRSMRDYGKAPDGEDMHWLGLSARMPEMNALIGRWSLARVDKWIAARETIVTRYKERLGELPGISFQRVPEQVVSSRNYVVILLDPQASPVSRDDLHVWLKQEGIQTKRYFYPALHDQKLYSKLDPGCAVRLPVAGQISATSLALPMYSHMSLDIVEEICDRIVACFRQKTGV